MDESVWEKIIISLFSCFSVFARGVRTRVHRRARGLPGVRYAAYHLSTIRRAKQRKMLRRRQEQNTSHLCRRLCLRCTLLHRCLRPHMAPLLPRRVVKTLDSRPRCPVASVAFVCLHHHSDFLQLVA